MRRFRSSILISWECRLQVVDNDTLLKSHNVTLHITLICAHSCYVNDLLKYVLKLGIIPPYVCSLVLQTVATLELLLLNITNITETLEAPGCNVIGKWNQLPGRWVSCSVETGENNVVGRRPSVTQSNINSDAGLGQQ